jgi:hypothetical protein
MPFKHRLLIVIGYGALLGACAGAPPGPVDPGAAEDGTVEQEPVPLTSVALPPTTAPTTAPLPVQRAAIIDPELRKVPNHDADITPVTVQAATRKVAAGSTASSAVAGSATTSLVK